GRGVPGSTGSGDRHRSRTAQVGPERARPNRGGLQGRRPNAPGSARRRTRLPRRLSDVHPGSVHLLAFPAPAECRRRQTGTAMTISLRTTPETIQPREERSAPRSWRTWLWPTVQLILALLVTSAALGFLLWSPFQGPTPPAPEAPKSPDAVHLIGPG